MRRRAFEVGVLYPHEGMDYFVYPRGAIGPLPAFAVGRPSWDNWMIYRARKLRIPVVDATAAALVIHQNHGHGHVKHAVGTKWEGPEADTNRALSRSDDFYSRFATQPIISLRTASNAPEGERLQAPNTQADDSWTACSATRIAGLCGARIEPGGVLGSIPTPRPELRQNT